MIIFFLSLSSRYIVFVILTIRPCLDLNHKISPPALILFIPLIPMNFISLSFHVNLRIFLLIPIFTASIGCVDMCDFFYVPGGEFYGIIVDFSLLEFAELNWGGSVVIRFSFLRMFSWAFLKMILFLMAAAVGFSFGFMVGFASVYGESSNLPSLPKRTLVILNYPLTLISLIKSWKSSSLAFSFEILWFILLNLSLW